MVFVHFISLHLEESFKQSFNEHHHLSTFVLINTENTLIFLGSTWRISVATSMNAIATSKVLIHKTV
jgi:hypothetical protein